MYRIDLLAGSLMAVKIGKGRQIVIMESIRIYGEIIRLKTSGEPAEICRQHSGSTH
jgi:hypothetical protein